MIDLTGKRFNRLLVQRQAGRDNRGEILWLCLCDCRKEKTSEGSSSKEKLDLRSRKQNKKRLTQ